MFKRFYKIILGLIVVCFFTLLVRCSDNYINSNSNKLTQENKNINSISQGKIITAIFKIDKNNIRKAVRILGDYSNDNTNTKSNPNIISILINKSGDKSHLATITRYRGNNKLVKILFIYKLQFITFN